MSKTDPGNCFEDFSVGQIIAHPTPRTVWRSDMTLYQALYGTRVAVQSSKRFARAVGYPAPPADDMLIFHVIFGRSVPDISLNAVANLGYAEGRFLKAVYSGYTLHARSEVIGLKENSSRTTGTVYVRTTGFNHHDEPVLSFVRWVMVNKRDPASAAPEPVIPELEKTVTPDQLGRACPPIDCNAWEDDLSGSPYRFDDYEVGERIDHVDGVTVEDAEHQMATRLYQNTSRVHFNHYAESRGRFGRRIVYGGHVISLARSLSFNGLANAFHVAGINGGRHVAPLFAGGTVFAWSEIAAKADIPGRSDVGALRIVTRATRDLPCAEFPVKEGTADEPGVVLEFDYWVLMPR